MINIKVLLISIFLLCVNIFIYSQDYTQTIRGQIRDKDFHITIPGCNVVLYKDSSIVAGTISDVEGYFELQNVSVGRYDLVVSMLTYRSQTLRNIIINSGKEKNLNILLEQSVQTVGEVVVTGSNKKTTVNNMTLVSARTFAVEETERYAGSRGDPARMASNFAGVQGADDSSNDIVIRGNSPLGVLWRVEGVNIPNPNHFGVSGTSGGPVTILNNKLLSNSDFMTGAFPAEYGNSIAGVFDLKLRNGNSENHEFSAQLGFLGTEMSAEGPLSSKKKSSYLVAYRYSTMAIFHALGIDIGTGAVPKYQDLSFKLFFPFKNSSVLSIFGIGGVSNINIMKSEQKDSTAEVYGHNSKDEKYKTGVGVVGVNYSLPINGRTFIKTTLSASIEQQSNLHQSFTRHIENGHFVLDTIYPSLDYLMQQEKFSLASFLNKKLTPRQTLKVGFFVDTYNFNFRDSILNQSLQRFEQRLNYKGYAFLIQPYLQWKYNVTEDLTINLGVHSQYLTINNDITFEPRFGMRWRFTPRQTLSAGVGMHSQMIPTYIYFANTTSLTIGDYQMQNKNLDFIKSNHYVVTYDNSLNNNLRLKVETYYQQLSNIPVEVISSSYSVLNEGADLNRVFPAVLENKGTGKNYGIEFTLEKFFSKTYFFMLSSSLYESKYIASDGLEYNSTFNGNYIFNLLFGKEFKWKMKNNSTFGLGGKLTFAGGKRYTPIDIISSNNFSYAVYRNNEKNTKQFKDYFRLDIKIKYKLNTEKLTHEIGFDLVNITDNKNILKQTYTGGNPPVVEEYQLGFLPLFYYKIDF